MRKSIIDAAGLENAYEPQLKWMTTGMLWTVGDLQGEMRRMQFGVP